MKPDPSKVTGMRNGSYDKLNDKGYVPEETIITNNDIIIGKVSPIQQIENSTKEYKDSSEVYNSLADGVVDKVYTNIFNNEGYEIRKMRIRSERTPKIGDKFSSRHGQKGTMGICLKASDMPFTKNGVAPDLIINTCLTGDTLVSLANGTSMRIDNLQNYIKDKLWSHNNVGIEHKQIINFLDQGEKETIKIRLADGRIIKCTPNHKFMVRKEIKEKENIKYEYIWKEAKDLVINNNDNPDYLVMGLEQTEDKTFDDEKDWELETYKFRFTMKSIEERKKTLAFARLLGYLMTDGTLCKSNRNEYHGRLYIGQKFDTENILDDIYLLTGKKPNCKFAGKTYDINLPYKLTHAFVKLNGMNCGRRTGQESSMPEFLLDEKCPKAVIREFLGGFFGGDGIAPYATNTDKADNISYVQLGQSIKPEYLDTLKTKMNNICKLLGKLNVNAVISRERKYLTHKEDESTEKVFVEIKVDSNLKFLENVGFRYCIQKAARLSIAASYERMREEVIKEHNKIFNLVNYKIDVEKKQVKNAIDEARTELYKDINPLNNYYSNITKYLVDNRRKPERKKELLSLDYKYFPKFSKYCEELGVGHWFSKNDDGTFNYITKREDLQHEHYYMKINSISQGIKEKVYDITVNDNHNFIANGIVVHNCAVPTRMTIAQLLESVLGKVSAMRGHEADGTPFNYVDIDQIKNELEKEGYHRDGIEYLYNGMTGRKMPSMIFIGPTYYLRLKHMVEDKLHSRARGPRTLLTHQATEGRTRQGGLKLGNHFARNSVRQC